MAWKIGMTNDHTEGERARPLGNAKNWLIVFAISVGVFALTYSPLLAMTLPYLRAGWPAFQTACWLRKADPWPARGRVGFYFHLAMAGFRAAVAGVVALVLMVVIEQNLQRQADLNQVMIALCVIMAGAGLSFSFGGWGTVIALRNRVRIFVVSDLKHFCHGDFSQIARLPTLKFHLNPANYVMAVALAAPTLTLWFVAVLLAMPKPDVRDPPVGAFGLLLLSLPVLGILIIALLIFLSGRMIARTPLECWGAAPPVEPSHDRHNWYRRSE